MTHQVNLIFQAENYILIVKKKLYMLLRGILSQDWPKYLQTVVNHLNNTPLKRLGWLQPKDINSETDSVYVDQAKGHFGVPLLKEPTYSEQEKNLKNFSGDIKVSDYVYKQFDSTLFDKSFDVSVSLKLNFIAFCINFLVWALL